MSPKLLQLVARHITFLLHVMISVFGLKDNPLVTLFSCFSWFTNAEELEAYIPSAYILHSSFHTFCLNCIIKYTSHAVVGD